VLNEIITDNYARSGHRNIAIAFKDFSWREWTELKEDKHLDDPTAILERARAFMYQLTLLSVVAMED
jgi:hypothetical protein